jgi:hypothetical protein
MKRLLAVAGCIFFLFTHWIPCGENADAFGWAHNRRLPEKPTGKKMKLKIGNHTFPATLSDNSAAAAFQSLLPLTLTMIELNGNEKYADLPRRLPADDSNPGTIRAGDLMLYGSSTLVVFYQTFPTSYRYTRLGRIDNASGLAAALGSGNVTITLEPE